MHKVDVLLALRPRMLSDVVRRILERQLDMNVVSEVTGPGKLLLAITATEAEVVIITADGMDKEPGIHGGLAQETHR